MKTSISKTLLATLAAAYVLTGCANMTEEQRAAAIGAGVGALAGVAVGDKDHKGQSAAIGAGVGALGGYIWSQQMEKKKQAMQQATAGTGATVTQTTDNRLKVNIPSDLSFDVGSYAIKSNMRPVLDQFASGLTGQTMMSPSWVTPTVQATTASTSRCQLTVPTAYATTWVCAA